MGSLKDLKTEDTVDYGVLYQTKKPIKVIKKDGSLEKFNVQKVIDAVGKSAYRALTKFTEEEKKTLEHALNDIAKSLMNIRL